MNICATFPNRGLLSSVHYLWDIVSTRPLEPGHLAEWSEALLRCYKLPLTTAQLESCLRHERKSPVTCRYLVVHFDTPFSLTVNDWVDTIRCKLVEIVMIKSNYSFWNDLWIWSHPKYLIFHKMLVEDPSEWPCMSNTWNLSNAEA